MSRRYCFLKETPPPSEPQLLRLSPEESAHLVRVHRLREGNPITALDGNGTLWHGKLSSAHPAHALLDVERIETRPRPTVQIHLAQAIPKNRLLEDILAQGTQLGLSTLTPLLTQRSEVHPKPERWAHQQDRLQTLAIEACKQSGNPFLPTIAAMTPLAAFLKQEAAPHTLKLYASLGPQAHSAAQVLKAQHPHPIEHVLWLVGPEGGFDSTEDAAILAAGFLPVSLGAHVLRLEVAALGALFLGTLI